MRKDTKERILIVTASAFLGEGFGAFIFQPSNGIGSWFGFPFAIFFDILFPYFSIWLLANTIFCILYVVMKSPEYLAAGIFVSFAFLGYASIKIWCV